MEKSALIHQSDSVYSFPLSNNTVEIRLLTKKNDEIQKVELVYNDKYKFHEKVKIREIKKMCSDEFYDYYIEVMKLTDTRFAYVFKITTNSDEVYYFSESGVTKEYDITKGFYDFFQVSYINELDLVKQNHVLQHRVFYQIFVDRFYRSEDNHNPRINIHWGDDVKRDTIAGGNLKGIIEKIDVLEDLGVDALYLTPIFESKTNHKYNTKDYYAVASDFGDETTLHQLIELLHERDMLLILDGVFNHIAKDNDLFQDVVRNGNKSKYFNWFFIHGDNLDLQKNNYERFADELEMPRLNLNHPEVQEYVIQVGRHYVKNYQIDGFRLDVSDEIPHRFWIRFKEEMQKINPKFVLIGENWHNAHGYVNSGYEFDSIMNYSITKEVLNWAAWQKISSEQFKNRIVSNLMRYKTNVNYNMFNLLSSHDVHRFFTECQKDVDRFLLGYAFMFMHIGVPCVYYGDEIGMEGNYDPDSRRCYPWKKEQWNMQIRETIKALIRIHKDERVNELDYSIQVENGLVVMTRKNDKKTIQLMMNMSGKPVDVKEKQILLANGYDSSQLNHKGFLICRKETEK